MHSLIALFFILCVVALISWGIARLPLPEVVRTIAWVLIGLFVLVYLYRTFVGGAGGIALN